MTQSKCVMSSFCPVALFRDTPIRNICISRWREIQGKPSINENIALAPNYCLLTKMEAGAALINLRSEAYFLLGKVNFARFSNGRRTAWMRSLRRGATLLAK